MTTGLTPPSCGASIYTPADGEPRVAFTTPEEEAIQMLLDGLEVGSLRELRALVRVARDWSDAVRTNLIVAFSLDGLSDDEVAGLTGEVIVQGEASDLHPGVDATVLAPLPA